MENNVIHSLKKLDNSIERLARHKKDLDIPVISHTQAKIIHYLVENKNRKIYQKDLENVIGARRSTVSAVVSNMVKKGIIITYYEESDKRKKRVVLSDESEHIIGLGIEQIDEMEEKITKGINNDDIKTFLKVIKQMENNILELKEMNNEITNYN